jgi:anti-sigma factor RsiW
MRDLIERLLRRRPPAGLTCRELVELVSDALEGELPPDRARRFWEHIAACEHCTEYVEQMRTTLALMGRLEPASLSPAVERELRAAFREWRTQVG